MDTLYTFVIRDYAMHADQYETKFETREAVDTEYLSRCLDAISDGLGDKEIVNKTFTADEKRKTVETIKRLVRVFKHDQVSVIGLAAHLFEVPLGDARWILYRASQMEHTYYCNS